MSSDAEKQARGRIEAAIGELTRKGDAAAIPHKRKKRLLKGVPGAAAKRIKANRHEPGPGYAAMAEAVSVDVRALAKVCDEQAMDHARRLISSLGGNPGDVQPTVVMDEPGMAAAYRAVLELWFLYGAYWAQQQRAELTRELYEALKAPRIVGRTQAHDRLEGDRLRRIDAVLERYEREIGE